MARTREFEPEEALDAAMQLFWERGYCDTSMDQLVEHTGVSRYGLYSTFGNKWELFLASLDKYEHDRVGGMLAGLRAPGASLESVNTFFGYIVEGARTATGKRGCLMCNTATEMGRTDAETTRRVDRYVDAVRAAFLHALSGARERGEIADGTKIDDLAEHLTTSTVGLFIMMKGGKSRKMIAGSVRSILASIPRNA